LTPHHPKSRWLIDFFLLAAIWGASFLFTKVAGREFGALPTSALRVLIATAFLLPLMWLRGQHKALLGDLRPILLVGMLNSGVPFALFAFAVLHISTGLTSILNATVPLFGALVAWVWLSEKPSKLRLLGLAIGFAGVSLLAWDHIHVNARAGDWHPVAAVLACLLATLCYGLAASFTKKRLMGIPALATATGSQIGACLVLCVPALFFLPEHMPSAGAWLGVLILGVVCTGLAYVLYFRIIEAAGPAKALTVTFLIPVFANAYGIAFLGEQLTLWMVMCAAIVLLGIGLSTGLISGRRQP
jgi:drug/metabolite transporter (DMT)-like permease